MKYGWLPWQRPQRLRLKRLVLWAGAGLITAQSVTVAAIQLASLVRRKMRGESAFPHLDLPPVQVGENALQLYDYGQCLYEDMLAAIEGARETIYLETFIWKGDELGQRFKDALVGKSNEGVDVYVVWDSFGNLVVPPGFKVFPKPLHAQPFRAITRPWHLADPRRYALEHRKILVIDGGTAFLGGYNIGGAYATKWRDTHLRIDGPAAADLARHFIMFWNDHASAAEQITKHYRRHFNPAIHIQGNNAANLTFPIRDMYIEAIDTAEQRIRLTSAYFVPDSALVGALLRARKRGVEVEILVPWISNHVLADWLARGYFDDLLRAGVRVFVYETMLHAKTCTIDGQWSTVGTANLDRLSAVGNYEINVEIYSSELAAQMDRLFTSDLTDAREICWDEWRRRPFYARLGEIVLEPLRALT